MRTTRTYKILVVEDEADLCKLVVDFLSSLGHEVSSARDGEEGLIIAGRQPDLQILFTDIVIPGKYNGVEFAHILKKTHPNIKIIYASGYPYKTLMENYHLESDIILLGKPYRLQELINEIDKLVD